MSGGVDWVQVRDRNLDGSELLDHTQQVLHAMLSAQRERGSASRLIVNRRVDIALSAEAHGVHLGFDAMSPEQARCLMGPDALVGVSAHHPDEIRHLHPATSYAHLAPIHAPLSKKSERHPLGLAALREASRHGIPVLAQGGIDPSTARAATEAGAAGIAVTGAILRAGDPEKIARSLREALDA
ncbi:thiamine phosphate synthase [Myxococcota bacterium]|nr:thiamine phosphate synthase [Myxococcota bacterium]